MGTVNIMKLSILALSLLFLIPYKVEANVESCLDCGSTSGVVTDANCEAGNSNVKRTQCGSLANYGCIAAYSNFGDAGYGWFMGCTFKELCVDLHNKDGDSVCCTTNDCNTMDPRNGSSTLVPSIFGFIL